MSDPIRSWQEARGDRGRVVFERPDTTPDLESLTAGAAVANDHEPGDPIRDLWELIR